MKQGVLTAGRVRLLLSKGHSCFRPRRSGERRRKSVHGCIVDSNLSVLNLVIVKKGAVILLLFTVECFVVALCGIPECVKYIDVSYSHHTVFDFQ